MQGLMMERPLLIAGLLEHAAAIHADREIVSYAPEEPVYRGCYQTTAGRVRQLSDALQHLGISRGDRIATLALSTHRHLEVFFAVSGIGAICHTVNPRLHSNQVSWILDHAEDALLFVDPVFLQQAEAALRKCRRRCPVVVMTDRASLPRVLPDLFVDVLCYEELLAQGNHRIAWPDLDETTAAALCYTSGTTGNPKGVLYSHRSQILHAFAVALPDVAGLSEAESVLPAAPMFHVNAWGVPFAAALTGARLVLPGPRLQGAALADVIESESVTIAIGVPTLWVGLIRYLHGTGRRLNSLKRVIVGGAACPRSMIDNLQDSFGIEVRHAWGMTEMSPLGTIATLKAKHHALLAEERARLQAKQGRPVFGVEIKIVDEAGRELPHDGNAVGEIKVRGPWVCRNYFRAEAAEALDAEGWFATGDVGSIDGDGFLEITDRQKDLIKCAGEWISSVEVENLAAEHPAVMQAAAIGVPDEKWGERPVVYVVPQPDATVSEHDILALYHGRVAKWCVPDRIVLVESLPIGATGKVLKSVLRALHAEPGTRRP